MRRVTKANKRIRRTKQLHLETRVPRKASRCAQDVRVGRSKAGLGLFATEPFKKRQFVAEYWGRKIPNADVDQLSSKYLFEINGRWTIDGSNRRNIARYINHSCRPNAEANVVAGAIIIRAIKKIAPGDEITYNYGRDYFDTFIKPVGCRCVACKKKRSIRRVSKKKKSKPN
jgi:SET domain-containing protein